MASNQLCMIHLHICSAIDTEISYTTAAWAIGVYLCISWTAACQGHKRSYSNVFDVSLQVTLKWSENTRKAFWWLTVFLILQLTDWFLTCITCFTFCLISSLAFVFKYVRNSHIPQMQNVQSKNQWGKQHIKDTLWSGNVVAMNYTLDAEKLNILLLSLHPMPLFYCGVPTWSYQLFALFGRFF